jgi:hypothetical protein
MGCGGGPRRAWPLRHRVAWGVRVTLPTSRGGLGPGGATGRRWSGSRQRSLYGRPYPDPAPLPRGRRTPQQAAIGVACLAIGVDLRARPAHRRVAGIDVAGGKQGPMTSRFAAVRVQPAHGHLQGEIRAGGPMVVPSAGGRRHRQQLDPTKVSVG